MILMFVTALKNKSSFIGLGGVGKFFPFFKERRQLLCIIEFVIAQC